MFAIGKTTTTTTKNTPLKYYHSGQSSNQHHRQRSSPTTKKWKEDLKRSCLERARQKRHELIKTHRVNHNEQHSSSSSTGNNNESASMMMISNEDNNNNININNNMYTIQKESSPLIARQVVEEELLASKKRMEVIIEGCRLFEEEEEEDNVYDGPNNIMLTEEELLQLMHEVEEELDREAEELFSKEINKVETYDEYLLQNQITYFEMWQEEEGTLGSNNTVPIVVVPCPLCSQVGLMQQNNDTSTKLSCHNCGFCLNKRNTTPDNNINISLEILQARMRELYEGQHYDCVSARFVFSSDVDFSGDDCLKAHCENCGMVATVL